ncbi:MAG: hypothetical protein AB1758_14625 [Candidatus Eremiobacterota bacterium]
MSKQWRVGVLSAFSLVILAFVVIACSESGTVPTGQAGAGGAAGAVGNVQLNLAINPNRAIPASFDTAVVTGLDAANQVVFTSSLQVVSPLVIAQVPTNVVAIQVDFYSQGTLVGRTTLGVTITANQTFIIDDPAYDDVVTGTPQLVAGTYLLTGADSGTVVGGLLNGTVTLDGSGNVTGGTITRRDATAIPPVNTVFNLTGGTFSIGADRNLQATLITNSYQLVVKGRASTSSSAPAIYGVIYGHDGSTTALSGYVALQRSPVNVNAGTLRGTYGVAGISVGFFGNPGYYDGSLTFDGAGSITGGSLTLPTGGTQAVSAGNYAVGADGSLTGTLNVAGLGAVPLQGSVSLDGTFAANGLASTSNDFLFLAGMPPPGKPCTNPNMPSSITLTGMRTVTGGYQGTCTANIGAGKMLSGNFDTFAATAVPILVTNAPTGESTFTVDQNCIATGTSVPTGGQPAVRLVKGYFSQDGSLYFGSLDAGAGPLQGGHAFGVLVK